MLNPDEIYVLGKAAVNKNRESYYQHEGIDMIADHPESFISHLDIMISRLERIKAFVIDYQKAYEKEENNEK